MPGCEWVVNTDLHSSISNATFIIYINKVENGYKTIDRYAFLFRNFHSWYDETIFVVSNFLCDDSLIMPPLVTSLLCQGGGCGLWSPPSDVSTSGLQSLLTSTSCSQHSPARGETATTTTAVCSYMQQPSQQPNWNEKNRFYGCVREISNLSSQADEK